ncbi:hypothetical protein T484DRAFT_1950420 [Baffinella frigidus]|nr:hypothetical protein T484DRAFT_1950420 [Cryptophyta sp. CCMP2293]
MAARVLFLLLSLFLATSSAFSLTTSHGSLSGVKFTPLGRNVQARPASLRGGGLFGGGAPSMGVTVTTTKPGDGATFPKKGDTLQMHYKGTLKKDGSKFDASYDRGTPFVFTIGVGQVIKGWDEGIPKMSLGEKATLTISSDYGYGARGYPPVIPENADLVFEVELLAIGNKKV